MRHYAEDEKNSTAHGSKGYGSLTALLIAAAVNAVVFILITRYTSLFYETNDDYAISQMIADGYPYIGFVNVYLCRLLAALQKMTPDINIFIASQLIMSFVSMTVILWVLLRRRKNVPALILAAAVIAVFSLDHYSSIQFTKTAALLMMAGLILLVDTYIHDRSLPLFLLAFLLFYAGVAFRQKGMFPALSYAGLYVLLWWIQNRKEVFAGERRPAKELILVVCIAAAALGPYGLDMMSDAENSGTAELKAAREYQAERVRITDYPTYEYYDDNRTEYEAAGFSENDIYMLDRWILDYDGAASYENLKRVNEINYPKVLARRSWKKAAKRFLRDAWTDVRDMSFTGMHIALLIALSLCMLISAGPRKWVHIAAFGLLTSAIYIVIFYYQRAQYRAFYVADAGAAFWLLYTYFSADKGGKADRRPVIRYAAGMLTAVLILTLMIPGTEMLNKKRARLSGIIESEEIAEYFAQNEDKIFIGPTTVMSVHKSYLDPLSIPSPEANVADTGGWETLSPYKLAALKKYGISNPVKDLIDNEKAYFFGDSYRARLTEYYNKWYGTEGGGIGFIKVDEIDGNGIYIVRSQL